MPQSFTASMVVVVVDVGVVEILVVGGSRFFVMGEGFNRRLGVWDFLFLVWFFTCLFD